MKQLFGYLKPFKKETAALMFLYAAQALCALFMPYVMSNIVEEGVRKANMDYIWINGGIMLAIAVAYLACCLLSNKVSCGMLARFSAKLRKKVFDKTNKLSPEQFSNVGTGSLITRTTDDISWLEETVTQLPYVIVTVPIMLIGGVVLSFLGDWLLALILLAVMPIALFAVSLLTRNMEKRWEKGDRYIDVQNRIIRERLSGIRVIRAFDKDEHEHKRAEHATRVMSDCFVKNNTLSGTIQPLATLLLNIATVIIIYVGSIRLQTSDVLKAGDIIAIIQYIALIANGVLSLSWTFAFIPHIKVSMGRIDEVLGMPVVEEVSGEAKKLGGSIVFRNVSFAYDGSENNAIDGIDLDIADGEIVGIIGGTGSGKSTLVKLITAFYSKVSGERFIGGESYGNLSAFQVRDNVAVALQKSMIFEGTVAENVKMGNRDATDEQLAQALEVVQMSDFVESHEEKTEYMLKQSGSNISGGQKQRFNIARTILKDASVYIFDDSFSALDFLTESKLRKALNIYLKGKTQIIITQRAATAMRCDKVYVMDKGRIVGSGEHKQLLKSCDVYREIYESQLGGGYEEEQ
ncbi:MAG: ABC transporter ATP-binding protein/permease [Corallococcus sp.]|nr:ABC transporter ATP-binding protein/permease [Corallococcus sp.]